MFIVIKLKINLYNSVLYKNKLYLYNMKQRAHEKWEE